MLQSRTRLAVLLTAFFLFCPSLTKAEVAAAAPDERLETATEVYEPWKNLKEGALNLFDRQNQWTAGIGLGSIIAARSSFDDDAQVYFYRKHRAGKELEYIGNEYLGTGIPGVLTGAAFWLAGDLMGSSYTMHAGQAQIETLFVTGILTGVMKVSFGRERPDGDKHSFPSGHTSTVFASAMVLQEFYGWKAGVPAFALGVATAIGRMGDNRHWLSDTVAGATIGMLIGHAYSRAHLDRLSNKAKAKESNVTVMPMIEPGGGGLIVRFRL